MNILVACEESGEVREAFRRRGHNAISCDLLGSTTPGPHVRGDVRGLLTCQWDMLLAFPPCTYLCSSGLHWNKRRQGRAQQTEEALRFVEMLLSADVQRLCLENPVGCISTRIRKPDQVIQPWQYGHPESKATRLWLKNLPPLRPTNVLPRPATGRWENQTATGQNRLPPSRDRARMRSKTYRGVAEAMAEQWGSIDD